jgi:hypothetical protein
MTPRSTALPRRRARIALVGVVFALTAAACGDDRSPDATVEPTASTSAAPDTTPASTASEDTAPESTAPAQTAAPADTPAPDDTATPDDTSAPTDDPSVGLRGKRYCEVLVVTAEADSVVARVYGTFPINDCPPDAWAAVDTAAIAAERSAIAAVTNGPRFWLMDRIAKPDAAQRPIESFSGLEMREYATVDITELGLGAAPYTEIRVDRAAVFTFDAGSTVYEITSADGESYLMQSWSQQVDPTIDEEALATLGDRLALPDGWSYAPRVLETAITADSTGEPAGVIQDEFKNTYSLID